MTVTELLNTLASAPETVDFPDVISAIDDAYTFTETRFKNGATSNDAGQNNGSCKILSFARLQDLSPESTLACFGKFYFNDVLNHPEGDDHQNIRQFMIHGWEGVEFSGNALTPVNRTIH